MRCTFLKLCNDPEVNQRVGVISHPDSSLPQGPLGSWPVGGIVSQRIMTESAQLKRSGLLFRQLRSMMQRVCVQYDFLPQIEERLVNI